MARAGTKPDADRIMFNALENPTKLSIMFLLSRHPKMTVTQMSKHVRVGRPNLYHFVNQMVKDGILSRPEVHVKRNYVEKYYMLNSKLFESRDQEKQRQLMKGATPEQLNTILRSALAAFGLELRLLAEEFAQADTKTMRTIGQLAADERIGLSYLVLSDEAYEYTLSELKKVSKTLEKRWGHEKILVGGNRVILALIPNLQNESVAT